MAPPCYHCGIRPALLPFVYCPDCYQLTGNKLLTVDEVAAELGVDRTRVQQLARMHGLGLPHGKQGMRLFTPAMVDSIRDRRPGRPRREP